MFWRKATRWWRSMPVRGKRLWTHPNTGAVGARGDEFLLGRAKTGPTAAYFSSMPRFLDGD